MDELNYCVRHSHGKFNFLDKAYNKFIKESLNKGDDNIERWEIYNSIMVELISLEKMDYFEEAKYRLTGGENPNEVMLSMINKDFETQNILSWYKEKIDYFMDCDIIARFLKK